MNLTTCATCQHFRQFYGEKSGWCWGAPPPGPNAAGFEPANPPKVKLHRPACMGYLALPDGAETLQHAKASPETPNDAIKQAAALAAPRGTMGTSDRPALTVGDDKPLTKRR